ncbi:MAG: glycerophosphodiester phosphodiesterase [Anaerolineae bacterium]|nr:glycerophosphodiester phosphodiesterase [Anaerolineae bacterium]
MWIIIGLIIVLASWIGLHFAFRDKPIIGPYLIAHRGAAGLAPENTLAAVRLGLDHGAECVEVDIQQTKDGRLIVLHDATVDRTTNSSGAAADLTWDTIRLLDAGSWFSRAFAGESVPLLDQVLDLVEPTEATLVIEVKEPERSPGIVENLINSLHRYNAVQRVMIISFDHEWLVEFNHTVPDVATGMVFTWPRGKKAGEHTVLFDYRWTGVLIDPTLVRRVHRQGRQIGVWTVDHVWQMKLMRWLGVDAVTSNRPDIWRDSL